MKDAQVTLKQKIFNIGVSGANKRIYSAMNMQQLGEIPPICFNTKQYENVLIADDPDSIIKQFDSLIGKNNTKNIINKKED